MSLDMIYTDIIMEYSKDETFRRKLEKVSHHEHGHNPSCGDDLELELLIDHDMIKEAAFVGVGCAISMASTTMMCELITGVSVKEAKLKVKAFLDLIKSDVDSDSVEPLLEDAVILGNIKHLPARVKCAVLAWRTLDEILKREN